MSTDNPASGDADITGARRAARRLNAALIAVSPTLSTPYTDQPNLTPWNAVVRPALDTMRAAVDNLVEAAAQARVDRDAHTAALAELRVTNEQLRDELTKTHARYAATTTVMARDHADRLAALRADLTEEWIAS